VKWFAEPKLVERRSVGVPHLAVGRHAHGHRFAAVPVAVCKDRNAVDLRHILQKKDALVSTEGVCTLPPGSLVRWTFLELLKVEG